ncbi:MAG TPA: Fic family protein [Candidatus Hydrogenedentes bacterium]|nr:Fic family protein [Candidatus Hydrogenedentota bacterium]
MAHNGFGKNGLRPAGYAELIERYGLEVMPNWHRSSIAVSAVRRANEANGAVDESYPATYWPGSNATDHLEFALKYDGTNLAILASVFGKIPDRDLVEYVRSKPTGKYARRLWFLYEFLTGNTLPLEDVKQGNYVDLLDPDEYYTVDVPRRVRRQRINDNLLGNHQFCPVVRRTQVLRDYEKADLSSRCLRVIDAYSPDLLRRALNYLYNRETRSSFEIESIRPTSSRVERFVAMLQLAEQEDFCEKGQLVRLQNGIVDPRFRDEDYRSVQNYVGETITLGKERVHFASPKPEDLAGLMAGLEVAHRRMEEAKVHPVIHAATIAFGFVFLHPFEDGNGRIHRFLLHNILARRGFTPKALMFPVSAAMLKNRARYDEALEAFSRPLLILVDYNLDKEGHMAVHNDTAAWYRYIDMTPQAEALFDFIERTIDTELASELSFLAHYDKAKKAIQDIVDMPDRDIDLFIRCCLQNNGRIAKGKRMTHFDRLTDTEIAQMEEVVRNAYGNGDAIEA